MHELTRTEAIDLVGRGEAGQELPEKMRAHVRMLGALLGVIPLIALFLFLQRYFQSGLAAGAVKG